MILLGSMLIQCHDIHANKQSDLVFLCACVCVYDVHAHMMIHPQFGSDCPVPQVRKHDVLVGECIGGALYVNDFLNIAKKVRVR